MRRHCRYVIERSGNGRRVWRIAGELGFAIFAPRVPPQRDPLDRPGFYPVIAYHSLRAPQGDHSTLVDPPVADWQAALDENRRRLAMLYQSAAGAWLGALASPARRGLIELAVRQGADYLAHRPAAAPIDRDPLPILLSGHQPQWFHPGVWFKNALLARHATGLGCIPVHFTVDSDTLGRAEVGCWSGSPDEVAKTTVAFDQATPEQAIEDRPAVDHELLATFGARLTRTIAPFVAHPLIARWGGFFSERARATERPGWAIAQTRHAIEVAVGWNNLEARWSGICQQSAFARFAGGMVERAEAFALIHNECLAEYRAVHAIRSHSHPTPELSRSDSEVELPLWMWHRDSPRRRRVFLLKRGGRRYLSDREGMEIALPGDPASDIAWFPQAAASPIRLRPRALATTLFARLVLSDLFIHGIGGAKYDQLLDEIIRRWLGCEPPRFVTATATLWLPTARQAAGNDDALRAMALLRRLEWHPELAVDAPLDTLPSALRQAIEHKRALLVARPDRVDQAWHKALMQATAALRWLAASFVHAKRSELEAVMASARRGMILRDRELPFCLYPEGDFPRGLLDLTVETA